MSIKVISQIEPKNNGDFPIVETKDVKGGYRSVATHSARNGVTLNHREAGMQVRTLNDGKFWTLNGTIGSPANAGDDTDWTEVTAGGGSFTAAGDLTGDGTSQVVNKIRGVLSPDPSAASDGDIVEFRQKNFLDIPVDMAWDAARSKLWIADSDIATAYTYKPSDQSHQFYDSSGFGGATRAVAVDSAYAYLTTAAGGADSVAVVDLATGEQSGAGTTVSGLNGIVSDNAGLFWVVKSNNVDKYVLADVLSAWGSSQAPASTTAVSKASYLAHDGTSLFVSTGSDHTVLKYNPATMSLTGTFTHPGPQNTGRMVFAFGSVWVACASSVYRINTTTMVGTAVTGVTGNPVAIASDGTKIWVSLDNSTVDVVDPGSNSVSFTLTPDQDSNIYLQLAYDGTGTMYALSNNQVTGSTAISGWTVPPGGSGDIEASYETGSYQEQEYKPLVSFTAGGDLSGSSSSQTVTGLQGRPMDGTAPTTGQSVTWNGSTWIPTSPAVATTGENGTNLRLSRSETSGYEPTLLNGVSGETYSDVCYDHESRLIAIKDDRYVKVYDLSGSITTPYYVGTVFSVDLSAANFSLIEYVNHKSRSINFGEQYAFVAGSGGWRRIEFLSHNTGGAGAIVSTDSSYAVQAMCFAGDRLFLWDGTNGKIRYVSNPDAADGTAMVVTDLNANGSLAVGTSGGTVDRMAFDGTYLWAINGDSLRKINASTGAVTTPSSGFAGAGRAVLFDGKYLWVCLTTGMRRCNPADADPFGSGTAVTGAGTVNTGDIVGFDGTFVFMAQSSSGTGVFSAAMVDPTDAKALWEFQIFDHPSAIVRGPGGGGVYVVTKSSGGTPVGSLYQIQTARAASFGSLRTKGARYHRQKMIFFSTLSYFVQPEDEVILLSDGNTFTGAMTITLPPSSIVQSGGRIVTVIDHSGANGSGGNSITVAASAGDTLGGSGSVTGAYATAKFMFCMDQNVAVAGKWVRVQ